MSTLPLLAGLAVSILATSFLSGLFGMAGGMILMGILLLLFPVPEAMVLHAVTQMASNSWRAWLWRHAVDARVASLYGAGGLLAAALFAAVSIVPDKATVLILLGAMPFLAGLLPRHLAPSVAKRSGAIACGFVCTVLQLLAGVSGPVLDVFFQNAGMDRRRVVATKAVTQTFGHALKLAYFGGLAGAGLSHPWLLPLAVALAVTGTTLSRRLLDGMDEQVFQRWSRRLIATTGLAYMGQGLWRMFA